MKKLILFTNFVVLFFSTGVASYAEINETEYNELKTKVENLEQEKNKLKVLVEKLNGLISEDNTQKELIIGKDGEFNPYGGDLKNNILIGHGPFIKDKDKFMNTIIIGGNNSLKEKISSVRNGIILGTSNEILKGDKDDAGGQTSPTNNFVYGYKNQLIGSYASTIGIENIVRNSSRGSHTSQDFSFVIGKKNDVFASGYIIGDQNKVNTLKYYSEGRYSNITGASLYVNGLHNIVGSSGEDTKDNSRFVGTGVIVGNDNLTTEDENTIYGFINRVNGGGQNIVLGRGNRAIKGMTNEEWREKKLPYIPEIDRMLLYKTPEITYEEFLNIKSTGTSITKEDFTKVMEAIKEDINKIPHPSKGYEAMTAVGDSNTVRGRYSLAVGHMSEAIQESATALGAYNKAKAMYSTVIGNDNIAEKDAIASVVYGFRNYTTGSVSVNLGIYNNNVDDEKKNNSGAGSTAVGISNKTEGLHSLSVGYKNISPKELSIALGSYNEAGEKSVSVGYYNRSLGPYSQAIGDVNLTGERATAIGYWNNALTRNSVAIGQENTVSGYAGVAFGSQNNKNIENIENIIKDLNIENRNTGDFSTMFGISNISIGEYTQAFGNDNFSIGRKALSIGNSAKSVGYETIAIGTNSTVGPIQITKDKLLSIKRAVGIGSETSVAIDDAIALGSYSIAATEKGVYGYNPLTGKVMDDNSILELNSKVSESKNLEGYRKTLETAKTEYEDKKIELENKSLEINTRKWDKEGLDDKQKEAELQKLQDESKKIEAELVEKKKAYDDAQKKIFDVVGAWQSQLAALSIGDEATGRTRQITGVAAGTKDTDAVNVAQLKMLSNISVLFYNSNNKIGDNEKYDTPTLIDYNKLKLEFGDGLKAKKVRENENEKLLITIDRDSINIGSSSTTPGKTPEITINDSGNWVINGKDTGKPSKGLDGKTQEITINDSGNWVINGKDTGKSSKGENGKDGKTPKIEINDKGNWVIDGVDTNKPSKGDNANLVDLKSDDNISISKENTITTIGLKKDIKVNSISGLKDLNKNSDGSLAANKNYVDSKFNSVKNDIYKAVGGVANAISIANLTQVNYKGGYKKQISAGYGYYGGQNALSLGFSGVSENGKLIYKVSGSLNDHGNIGLGAGVGYQFDKEKSVVNDNDIIVKELEAKLSKSNSDYRKSQEEIKNLKNELDELKNIVNNLATKNEHKLYIITNYNIDIYKLTKSQENQIKEIVEDLNKNYKGRTIDITGFADTNATEKYNLELGLNRAKDVLRKLYVLGLDKSIVIGKISSFGHNNTISTNNTNEGKAKNRRVEIFIR